jgi:hypothetical protein
MAKRIVLTRTLKVAKGNLEIGRKVAVSDLDPHEVNDLIALTGAVIQGQYLVRPSAVA